MKQNAGKCHGQNGFTLIEVICALLLIGILTAVALVRITGTSDFDRNSQLEVIKGHLRLAQARAISSGTPCGIHFTPPKSYYMFQGTGSTTPLVLLGENNATVNLATKKSILTISSVTPNSLSNRITFDVFGSPGVTGATVTTSDGSIITITKNTGFIP